MGKRTLGLVLKQYTETSVSPVFLSKIRREFHMSLVLPPI